MTATSDQQALQTRIEHLEARVRKLSEEKANLYLVLHLVELLNPIAGVESFLQSLMSALCGSMGGTNVEIYYLDEGEIQYANLLSDEQRVLQQITDPLVASVFESHGLLEQTSDLHHTLLKENVAAVACTWVIPLMVANKFLGAIKMSDLLGSAQMRNYLRPFFTHIALILDNKIQTRKAESASKAKSSFLATMSHEIRTPLNGILGMAQLLAEPACDDQLRLDYAKTIINSGQTLLALLNDILDLSKIEANRLELKYSKIHPTQILKDVLDLFAGSAQQKGLQIQAIWHGPTDCIYQLDKLRVKQMLSNLVSNAIKFTHQGSILIEARDLTDANGKQMLEFIVTDTGIGIAKAKQHDLFKPFTQIDGSSTRRHEGSGLGLSLVLRFAELMQGQAGVQSEAGQGAKFWFRVLSHSIEAVSQRTYPSVVELPLPTAPLPEPVAEDWMPAERTFMQQCPDLFLELAELKRLLEKNLFNALGQFKRVQIILNANPAVLARFAKLGRYIQDMQFEQAQVELERLLKSLDE